LREPNDNTTGAQLKNWNKHPARGSYQWLDAGISADHLSGLARPFLQFANPSLALWIIHLTRRA
jgi:hypothetical protein